jgi:hypothetical protein
MSAERKSKNRFTLHVARGTRSMLISTYPGRPTHSLMTNL